MNKGKKEPPRLSGSPYVTDGVGKFNDELKILLTISKIRHYQKGQIIYMQGEKSKCFYFVGQGKVKLSIFSESGSEKIIAIQEDNTFFGESAAFDRYSHFYTAIALEESDIHVIDIDEAENMIRAYPEISFLIITTIIRRLRLLGLQVKDLSFLDAQKKVAHVLLRLMHEVGERGSEGMLIKKRITHEDLANITGLSRVTVTNVLNHLNRLKLITKGRLKYTIIDPEKLESLLEVKE
ncbi:MAG TPA: Crp/Fnr family transcriptional regulator [Syntrophorhabdaceae bacterium]|nr:Crp/Fnr family transcriptional regulator [Syntrophorhabdaceae bacterium]HQM82332.1 Crp/Fnr family transcriptional regulator [Syntrophorhabdaceae bacterium]